jgi:hypothetical protein
MICQERMIITRKERIAMRMIRWIGNILMVRANIIKNVVSVVIIIRAIIKGKAQTQIENTPTHLKASEKTPTILSIQNGVIDTKMRKKNKMSLQMIKKKLLKRRENP